MATEGAIDAAPVGYEEYVAGPETTEPVEVVDGQVIVNASPVGRHQHAVFSLAAILRPQVPEGFVVTGSLDWVLRHEPLLVRQPDVAAVSQEQARADRLESPPLLAVEVVSPDSRERDLVTKRREW